MKRRSKGDAGADGGFDGSGIAFKGGSHSYERRRTQGPEPRRRVGMHGAASVRIPNPIAKSEALPPRPFVVLCTATRLRRAGRRARLCWSRPVGLCRRNRLRFAEPAGCACYFWRNRLRFRGASWLRLAFEIVAPPPPSCRRTPAPSQVSTKRQWRFAPSGQHVRMRCTLSGSREFSVGAGDTRSASRPPAHCSPG